MDAEDDRQLQEKKTRGDTAAVPYTKVRTRQWTSTAVCLCLSEFREERKIPSFTYNDRQTV